MIKNKDIFAEALRDIIKETIHDISLHDTVFDRVVAEARTERGDEAVDKALAFYEATKEYYVTTKSDVSDDECTRRYSEAVGNCDFITRGIFYWLLAKASRAINEELRGSIKQRAKATQSDDEKLSDEIIAEMLPILHAIVPEHTYDANTKLMNKLADVADDGIANFSTEAIGGNGKPLTDENGEIVFSGYSINVGRAKNKTPVDVTCMLFYEGEGDAVSTSRPLTAFDRSVYAAVTAIYVEGYAYPDGKRYFTPAMIWRAMNGLKETEYVHDTQIKAIEKSLDKMRFTRAVVDLTEQLAKREITLTGKNTIKAGKFDTYLLAASVAKLLINGKEEWGYCLLDKPVLYDYAQSLGEVITVPARLLKIVGEDNGKVKGGSLVQLTPKNIVLRDYLIRRIEGMKNRRNHLDSRRISLLDYEHGGKLHRGLYSHTGYINPSKTETNDTRRAAEEMLDYWVRIGYIKGYSTYKSGRAIAGYELQI